MFSDCGFSMSISVVRLFHVRCLERAINQIKSAYGICTTSICLSFHTPNERHRSWRVNFADKLNSIKIWPFGTI